MMRALRSHGLYLAGLVVLGALAGCGRNYFLGEREPWRHEAEVNCIKSGAVRESTGLVRIEPIEGPGMCGADFPLKVAAIGESRVIGFADEIRPPGTIPGAPSAQQPKWPIAQQPYVPQTYTPPSVSQRPVVLPLPPAQGQTAAPGVPMSISPPGLASGAVAGPYDRSPAANTAPRRPSVFDAPRNADDDDEDEPAQRAPLARPPGAYRSPPTIPLGPRSFTTASIGPVEVKPAATLACPIVSALDQWIMNSVQPAALRWFGQSVVEMKQISAYSCRGMNGNSRAHISEHAFGNALDIAAFTLADGRRISVKDGWRGLPEEQGFLHDIQGAACQQFKTVLAPGSNVYHYDHIHVDLMRRASGRVVCEPSSIPGDVVAARAAQSRGAYAKRGEPAFTGSIKQNKPEEAKKRKSKGPVWRPLDEDDEEVMEEREEHSGVAGED